MTSRAKTIRKQTIRRSTESPCRRFYVWGRATLPIKKSGSPMALPARLGGFKILKDIRWTSVVSPMGGKGFAGDVCRRFSEEKINLPLLACGRADIIPAVRFAVEAAYAEKALSILKARFPDAIFEQKDARVLSVFPHRNDPEIVGAILRILVQKEIFPLGLINSPSAISIVLDSEQLDRTAAALFEPFRFSAYQTPADWKLAQKGKEQLFKEVIASYQEKKPKVYALEWYGNQVLVQARLSFTDLAVVAEAFTEQSPPKTFLTFFALSSRLRNGSVRPSVLSARFRRQMRGIPGCGTLGRMGNAFVDRGIFFHERSSFWRSSRHRGERLRRDHSTRSSCTWIELFHCLRFRHSARGADSPGNPCH